MSALHVCVELSGGAELLFGGKKHLRLIIQDDIQSPWTLSRLLVLLREEHLKERPELFLAGDSVRPGILVLINEADWELCGQLEYQLKDRDIITFISTLHGG